MKCTSNIVKLFENCETVDEKYKKIMDLGNLLLPFDPIYKVDANLVRGCQSRSYLFAKRDNQKISFFADSDALIVKGIAYLLLLNYENSSPKEILTVPPYSLEEIGLYTIISPLRATGLQSFYLKMKQLALKFL